MTSIRQTVTVRTCTAPCCAFQHGAKTTTNVANVAKCFFWNLVLFNAISVCSFETNEWNDCDWPLKHNVQIGTKQKHYDNMAITSTVSGSFQCLPIFSLTDSIRCVRLVCNTPPAMSIRGILVKIVIISSNHHLRRLMRSKPDQDSADISSCNARIVASGLRMTINNVASHGGTQKRLPGVVRIASHPSQLCTGSRSRRHRLRTPVRFHSISCLPSCSSSKSHFECYHFNQVYHYKHLTLPKLAFSLG